MLMSVVRSWLEASNFIFLQKDWPEVFESASKAESLAGSDARTACFYARRALELAVRWLYKRDGRLNWPRGEISRRKIQVFNSTGDLERIISSAEGDRRM
jgi:hypothetical protein